MKNHFLEVVRYNHWATNRLVEFLKEQDEKILTTEVVNSFSSILKTLYHIWDAQLIWFFRIGGGDIEFMPSSKLNEPIEEYFPKLVANCAEWINYLEGKSEAFFESECEFFTMSGEKSKKKASQIIQHCMNHATYHRGQIITLCKQLGINEVVSTDYIAFVAEYENLA